MKRKILIVTDDAGESFEILYAMYRFKEAGMQPVLAATKKKRLNGVIHDFYPGWNTYIEKPGYLIEADVAISQVKAKDYDAMVLMGGRAPEFLRHHKGLIRLVKQFHQLGKGLFSVCHGIQILIAAGLCQGKKNDLLLQCSSGARIGWRQMDQQGKCVRRPVHHGTNLGEPRRFLS